MPPLDSNSLFVHEIEPGPLPVTLTRTEGAVTFSWSLEPA